MSIRQKLRILIVVVFFPLMAGCSFHYTLPEVVSSVTPPTVVKKIPLKVGVLIPDENYVLTKTWKNPKVEESITLTVPFGQIVKKTSLDVLSHVFESVEFIKGEPYPSDIESIVIPTIQDFQFNLNHA